MKFCISLGKFELKYFFYCVLIILIEIYNYYFVYYDEEKIISEHYQMHSFCFFLGYLLNIIPAWINNKNSKEKGNHIENKHEGVNNNSIEYI